MPKYFIEVGYKGTHYAGFQIQENANTIQSEIEKALLIYFKVKWSLTGSSRTDAGVHAKQNFFHADSEVENISSKAVYGINAILPADIVLLSIKKVASNAHARFDAIARSYVYTIYNTKNPFNNNDAYFFPFALNYDEMNMAAALVMQYTNFESFSKKHTQVNNNICTIGQSYWIIEENRLQYHVTANRFLRGMVKALVATMLKLGTGKITLASFEQLLQNPSLATAFFNAPSHGLCLQQVHYPPDFFKL
jgi:tRNA pseudouridine38-40 synthase